MPNLRMTQGVFDRSEYKKADLQLRLVQNTLSPDAVSVLAREVVTRLAIQIPRLDVGVGIPSDRDINLFCAALLSADDTRAERFILAVRRDGISLDPIYLGYIAGAARKLGQMWDEDELSFVQVTLGCGKLYKIIRGLRHVIAPTLAQERDQRPAMFALVPGETHTLGIEIATDTFRREGWDIDMMVGLDHAELITQSDQRVYSAIVLVANSDEMIDSLSRLVLSLRLSQPLAHVLIAGNILKHYPDISELVAADAVIDNIETAVETLRALLEDHGVADPS